MVPGEIKKYGQNAVVHKTDFLGWLFGSLRMLGMHLSDNRKVEWYVEQFKQGNYRFEARTA
jgi:hypothetical protein